MTLPIDRRGLAFGLLAATLIPARAPANDHGDPLPDDAAFWRGLPLPFTPTEAWGRLSPAMQTEIGAAVIGMVLAEYVSGIFHEAEDRILDEDTRADAEDIHDKLMGAIPTRLWTLFPDLYGPEGEHPRWALEGGLAR